MDKLVKIIYISKRPGTILDGSHRRVYHNTVLEFPEEKAMRMIRNRHWKLYVEKKTSRNTKSKSQSRGVSDSKIENSKGDE